MMAGVIASLILLTGSGLARVPGLAPAGDGRNRGRPRDNSGDKAAIHNARDNRGP